MENIITEWLRYLTATIQTDIQQFDHWWMWVPFLIPAMLFFVWLLMKFMLLTMPFWLPVRMAFGGVRGVFWHSVKKHVKGGKKKKNDKETAN